VHVRLTDVFDYHWDPVLPHKYLFVVGSGNELLVVLNELNGVNCPQMLFVLLDNLSRPRVELQNLFVLTSNHKDILLVVLWIEGGTERQTFDVERVYRFPSFCVPKLHIFIISS